VNIKNSGNISYKGVPNNTITLLGPICLYTPQTQMSKMPLNLGAPNSSLKDNTSQQIKRDITVTKGLIVRIVQQDSQLRRTSRLK
jgi:hypothetical protein